MSKMCKNMTVENMKEYVKNMKEYQEICQYIGFGTFISIWALGHMIFIFWLAQKIFFFTSQLKAIIHIFHAGRHLKCYAFWR